MQLPLPGPADDVAARRGRRQPPLDGDPGLRGVELRGRAVQHHGELPEAHVELPLEPLARVLELGEHARGVGLVALVMARDERLGCRLRPGRQA